MPIEKIHFHVFGFSTLFQTEKVIFLLFFSIVFYEILVTAVCFKNGVGNTEVNISSCGKDFHHSIARRVVDIWRPWGTRCALSRCHIATVVAKGLRERELKLELELRMRN